MNSNSAKKVEAFFKCKKTSLYPSKFRVLILFLDGSEFAGKDFFCGLFGSLLWLSGGVRSEFGGVIPITDLNTVEKYI